MGFKPRRNFRVSWWPKPVLPGMKTPEAICHNDFTTKQKAINYKKGLPSYYLSTISRLYPYKLYTPPRVEVTEIWE